MREKGRRREGETKREGERQRERGGGERRKERPGRTDKKMSYLVGVLSQIVRHILRNDIGTRVCEKIGVSWMQLSLCLPTCSTMWVD